MRRGRWVCRVRKGLLNSKVTAQERDSWNRLVLKDRRRGRAWYREVVLNNKRKRDWKANRRMSEAPFSGYAQSRVWVTLCQGNWVGTIWREIYQGITEDQMVGWHHRFNGHEFEQAPGDGERQGSLACCSSWGHKEWDTTEQLNN